MSYVRVTITVAPTAALDEVAERCGRHGFKLNRSLRGPGILFGVVPEDRYDELGSVEGVIAVEPQRDVNLSPEGQPQ